MVSLTKKLDTIRAHKHTKQGKKRKRLLRAKGSTPPFPIHKEAPVPAAKAAAIQKAPLKPAATQPAPKAPLKPAATQPAPKASQEPSTTTVARIALKSLKTVQPASGQVVEKKSGPDRSDPRSS